MATKRGRPPADPNKTKAEYLEVRLEAAEKQSFKKAAALSGLGLSAWVRERLRLAVHDEQCLAEGCGSIIAPVETFDPDPYMLFREIKVLVLPDDGSFVATLVDANINASGETIQEAVANLKDTMIDLYEMLDSRKDELGKRPTRQLAYLRTIMRRKERHGVHHQNSRPENREKT